MKAFRILLIIVFLSSTYEFGTRTGPSLAIIHFSLIRPSNPMDLQDSIKFAMNFPKFWESFAYWGPTFDVCSTRASLHQNYCSRVTQLLISDALVLWRAWVILDVRQKRRRRLLSYVIMLLMIGNIGKLSCRRPLSRCELTTSTRCKSCYCHYW